MSHWSLKLTKVSFIRATSGSSPSGNVAREAFRKARPPVKEEVSSESGQKRNNRKKHTRSLDLSMRREGSLHSHAVHKKIDPKGRKGECEIWGGRGN